MSPLWHLITASLFLPHVPVAIEPARRHDVSHEVVFAQQSLGTSPEGQMLLQMQGVFAEHERALIQERRRRGQVFAARQGRVNWGNPP